MCDTRILLDIWTWNTDSNRIIGCKKYGNQWDVCVWKNHSKTVWPVTNTIKSNLFKIGHWHLPNQSSTVWHLYRPHTKFAKGMFSHMSVCPQGGGSWSLSRAVSIWGVCVQGVLCWGVCVQEVLCSVSRGGVCVQWGLCPGGSLSGRAPIQ